MKTKKPHVIIFSGYGLNTEDETKAAFELAGATADIIHINDVIANPATLKKAQILVVPGGFSYGDDTGAGKAYGNRVKQHLGAEIEKFLARDTLMIGICNGFQIITNAGFVSGALIANDSALYSCRWVDLEVVGNSPWLKGIKTLSVPIAHGEGKYYAPPEILSQLKKDGAVALKYADGETTKYFDLRIRTARSKISRASLRTMAAYWALCRIPSAPCVLPSFRIGRICAKSMRGAESRSPKRVRGYRSLKMR